MQTIAVVSLHSRAYGGSRPWDDESLFVVCRSIVFLIFFAQLGDFRINLNPVVSHLPWSLVTGLRKRCHCSIVFCLGFPSPPMRSWWLSDWVGYFGPSCSRAVVSGLSIDFSCVQWDRNLGDAGGDPSWSGEPFMETPSAHFFANFFAISFSFAIIAWNSVYFALGLQSKLFMISFHRPIASVLKFLATLWQSVKQMYSPEITRVQLNLDSQAVLGLISRRFSNYCKVTRLDRWATGSSNEEMLNAFSVKRFVCVMEVRLVAVSPCQVCQSFLFFCFLPFVRLLWEWLPWCCRLLRCSCIIAVIDSFRMGIGGVLCTCAKCMSHKVECGL